MRNFLKWTWRVMLALLIITMFLNDLAFFQIALLLGIVMLRAASVKLENKPDNQDNVPEG